MQTNIADNFEILLYLKLFSEIRSFSASLTIPPLTFAAMVKTTCFTFFWTTVFMMLVVLPFFPNSPTCSKIETKWQICHNYGLLYSCSTFEINKNLVNLQITTEPTVPFSAVTICSLNPYKRSPLQDISMFDAFVRKYVCSYEKLGRFLLQFELFKSNSTNIQLNSIQSNNYRRKKSNGIMQLMCFNVEK